MLRRESEGLTIGAFLTAASCTASSITGSRLDLWPSTRRFFLFRTRPCTRTLATGPTTKVDDYHPVYFIGMPDGGIAYNGDVNNKLGERALCVRTVINREQSPVTPRYRYAESSNASAIDTWTSLQWQVPVPDITYLYNEQALANQYCKDLRLDGHADWRLPHNKESVAMMDERRAGPCVDVSIFPQPYNGWVWNSNTNWFFGSSFGWAWSSSDGVSYVQTSPGNMRCVRTLGLNVPCTTTPPAVAPPQPCTIGCCGGSGNTKSLVRFVLTEDYSKFQCSDWLSSVTVSAGSAVTACTISNTPGIVTVDVEMDPASAKTIFSKASAGNLGVSGVKSVIDPTTGRSYEESGGLSGGAIAGIVIAVLVVVAVAAVVAILVARSKAGTDHYQAMSSA